MSLKSSHLSLKLKFLMAGAQSHARTNFFLQQLTLDSQKNQIIGVFLPLLSVNKASQCE